MIGLDHFVPDDPDDPDDDHPDGPIEFEGAATMGNYGNPTANAIDNAVQASKRASDDGEIAAARIALRTAQERFNTVAQRPALPADDNATRGLRYLRTIASRNEEAGRYAVGLIKALTPEQFAAIKPRVETLPARDLSRSW